MSCAEVLNAQPHIDGLLGNDLLTDVLNRVQPNERSAGEYGYALQHKHFELSDGECLFFEFAPGNVLVSVRAHTPNMYPCLYYTANGKYHAVGFTEKEADALMTPPNLYCDGLGVASPAFRRCLPDGVVELTNEKRREQRFVSAEEVSKKLGKELVTDGSSVTMVFFDQQGELAPKPWKMLCIWLNGAHDSPDDD